MKNKRGDTIWNLVLIVAIGSLMVGCNDSSTSADTDPSAELELSINPDPATAQPSTGIFDADGNEYQWMASFTLTITETAGVGGDVDSLSTSVSESSGGIVINSSENELFQVVTNAETSRVDANSSSTISFDAYYTLPGGGRECIITVSLRFVDDNDYYQDLTAEVTAR